MLTGIGLRPHHFIELTTEQNTPPPFLEIISDNLMGHKGGSALYYTDLCAKKSSILLHGVGLNLGGHAPVNESYLKELKSLKNRYEPQVISDHLCFTHTGSHYSYELLPLPRTQVELKRVIERVHFIQEYLNSQISIENISAYVDYNINEMTEGEFFTQLAKSTGCGILLDVNNLFVNSFNFNRNLEEELFDFPFSSVTQIHIAGHTICDDYLFDTHDKPVCHEVINLLKIFLLKNKFKNIPLILECDDNETSAKQLSEQWESIKRHVQS